MESSHVNNTQHHATISHTNLIGLIQSTTLGSKLIQGEDMKLFGSFSIKKLVEKTRYIFVR